MRRNLNVKRLNVKEGSGGPSKCLTRVTNVTKNGTQEDRVQIDHRPSKKRPRGLEESSPRSNGEGVTKSHQIHREKTPGESLNGATHR